jgi:RNA polymerase sigma factor (sigma-70 family)
MSGETHTIEEPTGALRAMSFADVYTTYSKFMKRVAMRKYALSIEDADELVHDVFTTYLGHASDDVTSLRAYLIIAICRAARRRTDRRRSEERLSVSAAEQEIPDAATERGILLRMAVADALTSCSPRCRELLYRHHMRGESAEEIALSLGTTPQYIRQLLSGCRKRIREGSRRPLI